MPVGKNSLTRAAKQVAGQKQEETVAKTEEIKKTPAPKKKNATAKAMEVLPQKAPAKKKSPSAVAEPKKTIPAPQADTPAATPADPCQSYAIGDALPYYLL